MRTRSLLVLAVVTAAALAGAVAVSVNGPRGPAATGQPRPFLTDLAARKADISRIVIKRAGGDAVLARDGDHWVLPDKSGYPVDGAKLETLLTQLAALRLVAPRTADPDLLSRLDLADVSAKDSRAREIDLLDAAGKPVAAALIGKAHIGQTDEDPAGLYVRTPGDPQTWLARGTVDLPTTTIDWARQPIADVNAGDVRRIILKDAGAAVLTLDRAAADQPFTATPAAAEGKSYDPDHLADLADTFLRLRFSDVRPAPRDPPAASGALDLQTADGLAVDAALVTLDGSPWVALGATGKGAEPIQAAATGWLFKLDDDRIKKIATRPDELLVKPKG